MRTSFRYSFTIVVSPRGAFIVRYTPLQAAIHPQVRLERLGPATVSITLDPYSHAIPAMQEEAAALIAGLVLLGR